MTKDPRKAWDLTYTMQNFRTPYDYMEFELAQFGIVCLQKILDDNGDEISLDISKFRLKHIVSLNPLEFEDFDGKYELGFVRFFGRIIP